MAAPLAFTHLSDAPVFNTKAVARDTDVPADTFRAWERRYGVPRPQRTPGGHRLYSERDIAIIRWLRDRTQEGVNISHAVMLLMNMLEVIEPPVDVTDTRSFERMLAELVNGLTTFDVTAADRILGEAFTIYPFEDVLLSLVQPALIETGERWHRGEINVAAEHFSTEYVRRKIASFLNVFENNAQRETIVIGCAPFELHDVGILLSSVFLIRRGWHVLYLGAQVPESDLLQTIQATKPALVCLSASTLDTAQHLAVCGRRVQKQFPNVRFGYGGRIFNQHPELREQVPGIFLGQDARMFVDHVAQLLARPSTSVISKAS